MSGPGRPDGVVCGGSVTVARRHPRRVRTSPISPWADHPPRPPGHTRRSATWERGLWSAVPVARTSSGRPRSAGGRRTARAASPAAQPPRSATAGSCQEGSTQPATAKATAAPTAHDVSRSRRRMDGRHGGAGQDQQHHGHRAAVGRRRQVGVRLEPGIVGDRATGRVHRRGPTPTTVADRQVSTELDHATVWLVPVEVVGAPPGRSEHRHRRDRRQHHHPGDAGAAGPADARRAETARRPGRSPRSPPPASDRAHARGRRGWRRRRCPGRPPQASGPRAGVQRSRGTTSAPTPRASSSSGPGSASSPATDVDRAMRTRGSGGRRPGPAAAPRQQTTAVAARVGEGGGGVPRTVDRPGQGGPPAEHTDALRTRPAPPRRPRGPAPPGPVAVGQGPQHQEAGQEGERATRRRGGRRPGECTPMAPDEPPGGEAARRQRHGHAVAIPVPGHARPRTRPRASTVIPKASTG